MPVKRAQTQARQEMPEKGLERGKIIAKRRATLRWWVGTVFLTLFPTLATTLVILLQGKTQITWDLILGDGEIILASFLIVASTLITSYNVVEVTLSTDVVRYVLIFLIAIQLICYAIVKTTEDIKTATLLFVSFVALFISICISWVWFIMTNKGD